MSRRFRKGRTLGPFNFTWGAFSTTVSSETLFHNRLCLLFNSDYSDSIVNYCFAFNAWIIDLECCQSLAPSCPLWWNYLIKLCTQDVLHSVNKHAKQVVYTQVVL